MDAQTTFLTLVVGLLFRLALPILVTLLVVYGLRLLDEHWKRQAQDTPFPATQARNIGCWEINKCTPEKRSGCAAFANPDKPCWQVFRQPDGHLQERCLGCQIFRHSPIPIPA